MQSSEVLVVGPGARSDLGRWTTIAQVPPDIVVIRADPDEVAEVAEHARLAIARMPRGETRVLGDEQALDELDEGARLFVTAWRERPAEKKDRPGEGLAWDAPGFDAPGSPRGGEQGEDT